MEKELSTRERVRDDFQKSDVWKNISVKDGMLSVDPLKLVQFFDNLITQVQEETKAACEKAIEQGMDEEEARTAIRNITLQ